MEGEQTYETSASVETGGYSQESSEQAYETSSDNSSQGSYEGSGESESGDITATSDDGTSFGLYTDPATGKTEFRVTSPDDKEEEGSPEEEYTEEYGDEYGEEGLSEQYEDTVNQNSYEMPKYSLDEFSYALANGTVDENRVPEEYQNQYADYKISQAKAVYNNRIQEEVIRRQQLQEQLQAQSTPEARIAANENFYKNLELEAERFAMHDLGITKEALDDAEYSEDGGAEIKQKLDTAKNWHKQRLMNELQGRYQHEQAYKAQQQQIYREVGDFTRWAQQNEPHFHEIDKMLATAWQEMPTKYGSVVRDSLQSLARGTVTRQQAQVIQKYYEDTRRLYYARQNGFNAASQPKQTKRPPVTERAGNGQRAVKSAPDYSALRNADARGKKAWLGEFFKNIEL